MITSSKPSQDIFARGTRVLLSIVWGLCCLNFAACGAHTNTPDSPGYFESKSQESQDYLNQLNRRVQLALNGMGYAPTVISQVNLTKAQNMFAFSNDSGHILVSTKLISKLDNEAQLVFILAHENSHLALKHHSSGPTPSSRNISQEITADKLAMEAMLRCAYDPMEALKLLQANLQWHSAVELAELKTRYLKLREFYRLLDIRNVGLLTKDTREFRGFLAEMG